MEKNIESTRQLKVAKEIQKHMAEIIRSKGMAAFGGALVSVSGVKISPDLSTFLCENKLWRLSVKHTLLIQVIIEDPISRRSLQVASA